MIGPGQQKIEPLALAGFAAIAAAVGALSVAVPVVFPWVFVALIGAGLLMYSAAKWEITIWTWFWVLSYGLLDWPQWRLEISGFFNMNVPRFIFIAAVLAFFLHFLLYRGGLKFNRRILWIMLFLVIYLASSASATGWVTQITAPHVRSAPYFRFLGSILLPFTMFFLVYNTTRRSRQIKIALLALTVYGWYAIYIGYLQFAALQGLEQARGLIWPEYINNADYGIHFDRARGAFRGASPQAMLLVLLFFVDWFLINRLKGPYRTALIVQAILVPPAIFFTGMRSSFVAFALCSIVWCIWGARRRFGKAKLILATLALVIAMATFWTQITRSERLTARRPIYARIVLVEQTWKIFSKNPIFGVGFGHFVDAQQELPSDPGSLSAAMTHGVLVQHNLFLNMAAETGIIGLVATIALFVAVFTQSLKLYRKLPDTAEGMLSRGLVVLFWVLMVNYLTDAMFRDTLWDVFVNGLFWSMAGLIVGFNRLLDPQTLDLPSHPVRSPVGG